METVLFLFLFFEVLRNEEWFAFFLFGERVKDVGERKDVLLGENLPLFLSQAKAKVIWFIVKVKSQQNWFIFRHCYSPLNFVICGCLCYHPYSVCKTLSAFLYFVCLQCHLVLAWSLWCLSCVWAFSIYTIW